MKEVKCECGHINPHGTVLCEACGKMLMENEKEHRLVDMRYEGSARRSQTYNQTMIDKVWNFFSSVKVGIVLIVITLVASGVGTIFPQERHIPSMTPAAEYYQDQYGWLGKFYYELGFHNLYSSWWYLLLIASIGVSLVICSLDRFVPLYRALKNQRVMRHEGFLKRQRLFGITSNHENEKTCEQIKINLQAKRYHIREEDESILAEKGRFSRWGPYINHVGLIIFLIGGMLRSVPGMYIDETIVIREGETKVIPETNGEYYLKNEKFLLEIYEKDKDNAAFENAIDRVGMVPKNYQSNVTLFKKKGDTIPGEKPNLERVKDYKIRVNQPLKFENFAIYQVDYRLNQLDKMVFALTNKDTDKSKVKEFGTLTIDLNNPKGIYKLSKGYKVEILDYYPDAVFDENYVPSTQSKVANNPLFVFNMITPDKPEGELSMVAIRQTYEPNAPNTYKMTFKGVETKNDSILTVRKDLTIGVIILGGIIFMIGVVQGAYWNHRRIWIRKINGEIWVAGHTNKNWYGLKREISAVLDGTGVHDPKDHLEKDI